MTGDRRTVLALVVEMLVGISSSHNSGTLLKDFFYSLPYLLMLNSYDVESVHLSLHVAFRCKAVSWNINVKASCDIDCKYERC